MRLVVALWDQDVDVIAGERIIQLEGAAHHAYQHWWRSAENRRFSAKVAGALVSEDSRRRGERRAIDMRMTSIIMSSVLHRTTNHGFSRENEMR